MGGCRVGIWTDNVEGIDTDVAAFCNPNIGTADNRLGTVYADTVDATNVIGDPTLANNTYLGSTNAAGTGINDLLKSGTSNQTILNTPTATTGEIRVADTLVGSFSATQFLYPKYVLSDGSDKNYNVTVYAAGTAYSLTNTAAALDFGTTDPSVVINKAGTYMLTARVNLEYAGATFAANRTVTIKLRRTNNTAADLTNATTALGTNIVTTVNGVLAIVNIPVVIYTTTNTDDAIAVYGDVSVVPTAGALNATEANIVAVRLY